MSVPAPRKFTILDAMILVAAVAGAFALRRAVEGLEKHGYHPIENRVAAFAHRAIEAEFPFVVTLTPAALAMRLRRPRPRWRLLLRQPGMVASVAALVPIVASLLVLRRFAWMLGHPASLMPEVLPEDASVSMTIMVPPIGEIFGDLGVPVGLWVLGAWLALALAGRRHPERSWVDRLGRAAGIGWISIPVLTALAAIAG